MLLLISQFSLVIELFCLAKVVPAELCAGSDGSEEPLLILEQWYFMVFSLELMELF